MAVIPRPLTKTAMAEGAGERSSFCKPVPSLVEGLALPQDLFATISEKGALTFILSR